MQTATRSYSELVKLHTLEDRFNYLKLVGVVGAPTFGSERYINQTFYTSHAWRQVRHEVILRDNGCDLGVEDFTIHSHGIIHHMNPMSVIDIREGGSHILDPEYLVFVSLRTHNAIHYGDERLLPREPVVRRPGDTLLWHRKENV